MLAPYCDTVRVVDLGDDHVDVALVDAFAGHADDGNGDSVDSSLDAARALGSRPGVRHVALFTFRCDRRALASALDRGIDGVLSKSSSAPQLVDDLRRVAAGEQVLPPFDERPDPAAACSLATRFGLTDREADVLALLVHGRRNGEIAAGLDISRNTVKTHLRAVFRKLGVETRAQAVAAALGRQGHRASAAPDGLVDGLRPPDGVVHALRPSGGLDAPRSPDGSVDGVRPPDGGVDASAVAGGQGQAPPAAPRQ